MSYGNENLYLAMKAKEAKKRMIGSLDVVGGPAPTIHIAPDEDWETVIRKAPPGAEIFLAPGVYIKRMPWWLENNPLMPRRGDRATQPGR